MRPSFNIAGPYIPGEHYMLPPERRLGRVLELVEDRRIFTLHDGRQTGKTTSAMWLADHLDATGRWRPVLRKRITACNDLPLLERWLRRVTTAASVEEAFAL